METNGEGKPQLLYSGPIEALAALEEAVGEHLEVRRVEPEPEQVRAGLREAVAFVDASMKVRLNAEMIGEATRLQVIAVAATGADHIDDRALAERSIGFYTLRGQTEVLRNLTPAAELSWLLLMACARQFRAAVEHVLEAGWNRADFPGIMLRGRRLGLIGCGRIGTWMSRYGTAFGMECVGYDPTLETFPETIRPVSLDELLETSDFVSIHVPLTPETEGMLDRSCFERMKQGAVFVNTSRGDVADEAALLDALRSGRLAAAGLDVLTGEPDVESHPLRLHAESHPNLIITPHIGGFSPDAVRSVVRFSGERILRHLGMVAG